MFSGHMSQGVIIGRLGIIPYRAFTMEELEEATNGFDSSNLVSEGRQEQVHRLKSIFKQNFKLVDCGISYVFNGFRANSTAIVSFITEEIDSSSFAVQT